MKRWTGTVGILVLVTLAGSLLTVAAPPSAVARPRPLPSRFVDCGETVDSPKNFKLGNDLDCNGDGITIKNAVGKIVDLGGHILHGKPGQTGIILDATDSKVTIRNGIISGFGSGITANGSPNDSFTGLTFSGNASQPLSVSGGAGGGVISGNTFARGANVAVAANNMTVVNNTFVGQSLVLFGADGTTVRNNNLYGGGIDLEEGADGAQSNVIDANHVTGAPQHGIESLGGTTSTGNQIINNVVKASLNGDGIEVSDSPGIIITGNTLAANNVDGLELVQQATGAQISNNTIVGNLRNGVEIGNQASGAALTSNTVTNNGADGVDVTGSGAVLNGNTANFNGFLNGLQGDDNHGISAPADATSATANNANGNDVDDPSADPQCTGGVSDLCATPGTPTDQPATLTLCGSAVPIDLLLDNPLDCVGSALIPGTSGKTIDLGNMAVRADGSGPVIDLNIGFDGMVVKNGVVMGGSTGIDAALTNSQFSNLVIAGANGDGLHLGPTSAGDQFSNIAIGGVGGVGLSADDVTGNTFSTLTIAGNTGRAVVFSATTPGPASNVVTGSALLGNGGKGVSLQDSNTNTISKNRIIANAGDGVLLDFSTMSSTLNKISGNTIVGNDGLGVGLTGDNTPSDSIGQTSNTISANVIQANVDDGISIVDDADSTRNVITSNKVLANLGPFGGIILHGSITKTKITGNKILDSAYDGVYFEDPTNGRAVNNTANHNGFVGDWSGRPVDEPQGAAFGLGFEGVSGCENHAAHNDGTEQADPHKVLGPC